MIFDVKASAILLAALLKQTSMTILFRGHLNKVKGSARMDRGHKDTYCLGPREQNIRKAHHLAQMIRELYEFMMFYIWTIN